MRHPVAVATLPSENLIFWIDPSRGAIYRVRREGDDRRVVASNLQSPARLAVDWVAKLVFWTDDLLDVIEVADIAGDKRYVVVSGNLDRPRDVEVDSAAGILFWTDVGQGGDSIEKKLALVSA